MPGWRASPPDPAAAAGLLDGYLRLLGPGSEREAAGFLGTQTADAKAKWPDKLVELRLDGRRVYFPSDGVDELRTARPARLVRLLPPSDPFLQARDRDMLVPDRLRQKELWRPLGNPGAVLVDTEIVGTWRPRATAKRLIVAVNAFGPLSKGMRAAISREAELVAAVRGASDVEMVLTDGA